MYGLNNLTANSGQNDLDLTLTVCSEDGHDEYCQKLSRCPQTIVLINYHC